MAKARAAVFPAPNAPVEMREFELPALEPNSALMRVECSEVCGTDVHLHRGRLPGVPYPLIPGHVSAGTLAQVRGTMQTVDGTTLQEGDRVTFLDVHATCNRCFHCLVAKTSTRCPERRVYGITYGVEDGLCGGWSEYLYLKPGTRLIALGELSARDFLTAGCSLPTALHAIERARLQIGETVLVLGTGPVGLAAIALARAAGAATVLAIGGPAERMPAAATAGADATLDFATTTAEERQAWTRAATGGRGSDVVIEATGAPEAVVDAMRHSRDAGRVVVVGQYTEHGEVPFSPHADLNRKHLEVLGCWGSDYSHFHRAVEIVDHPRLGAPWRALPVEEYRLPDVGAALEAIAAGTIVKALVRP